MSNDWLQITLHADNEASIEQVEAALEAAGAIALTYQAGDDSEIYEPPVGETPLWAQTAITGLFAKDSAPEYVLATLKQHLGDDVALAQSLLADSEWTRAWLDHFKPIPFGERLWVAASEHVIEQEDAIVLRLDPGLAFGTGTHPSTAMCLDYLAHADLVGKSVYDYGCGSGILGIAAALLGANSVYQTDIDPQAMTASADNAAKNHISERITLCENPESAPRVDLLVANILLQPLRALKSQFMHHTDAASTLVFAGVLVEQAEDLIAHYADTHSLRVINEREGWVLLEGQAH
ncbi:50S ribosomal protein L11 methyltransferase [Suttonella sp. R2A3]|uniref:50S ribosomal protein L11 methyltransferase n=1 Tax=Suttonella sp. R2A3 TaxID=2908648 RepID=UPI001F24331C|nr:50S ribosomal protein L11 methyltransferase [Suttonella sp. R2A3]UJF24188.1 50S ribosomal protein L11 methyltransferase [Suttonella sp. R2A3]